MTTSDIYLGPSLRPIPLLCTRSADKSLTPLDLLAYYPSAGRHLPCALLEQLPDEGEVVFSTEVFDGVPLTVQQSAELQVSFHPFLLRDSIEHQVFHWAVHAPDCVFSALTITSYSPGLQNADIGLDSDDAFPSLSISTQVAAAVFFSICVSELRSAVTRHVVILDNGYLASVVACLTFELEPLDLRSNTCLDLFKYLTSEQSKSQLIEDFLYKAESMHKLNAAGARNSYRYFLVSLAWEELDLPEKDWESGWKHLNALEQATELQAQLKLKRLVWRTVTELLRWLQLI